MEPFLVEDHLMQVTFRKHSMCLLAYTVDPANIDENACVDLSPDSVLQEHPLSVLPEAPQQEQLGSCRFFPIWKQ